MTENKGDERRLLAAGFMLFGAFLCFFAGILFVFRWEGLFPIGGLPFLVGSLCYLWFALSLKRGNQRPVASLKTFAWGNILLLLSVPLFFRNYARYIGAFGDDPSPVLGSIGMLVAVVLFIQSVWILRGQKQEEAKEQLADPK